MFQAFVLGFWAVWSSDRDIHAVSEGLAFTILAVLIGMGMAFEIPFIDGQWVAVNCLLWAYVSLLLGVVNRYAQNFMGSLVMASIGALGYYYFYMHLPEWVADWMA
ncbi:multidrug transporter MatE [Neisseria zalophi]|uniref:Multidrug transporter MatE n=1 Tax=Neisseria zalophi TaxID=640030 RepID=A0A5J6Q0D3_9NEIS|nr:multidrug transporter MatE [Neisseria zalophi]QEY26380.1 multidrug transporter MatE [Neisseria zalophi]